MIIDLGSYTIATLMPTVFATLDDVMKRLLAEKAAIEGEIAALQSDLLRNAANLAALKAELASLLGLIEDIGTRIAAGPSAILKSIEDTIAQITSGALLRQLLMQALAGATAYIAGLQASLADLLSRKDAILARLAELAAVDTSLLARIAALIARIEGLLALLASLIDLVNGGLAGGLRVLAYDGPVGSFGSELDGVIGSGIPGAGGTGGSQAYGLVIVTYAAESWFTLSRFLRTGV